MLKAIKIKLYPNKAQEIYISKLLGCYRFVYNNCLALKKQKYDQENISFGLKQLGDHFHNSLTKNPDYSFLGEHNTKVLKQSILNLLDAYKLFFKNGSGFPKFKSKHNNKQTCRFPVEAISKRNDYSTCKITLTGDLKNITFRCSDEQREYLQDNKEGIKSATLTRTKSDEYFLSILVDGSIIKVLPVPKQQMISVDLGIKSFITTSNGEVIENLKLKRTNQKKLNKLHRNLSRKTKGSNNRNKQRIKLAKFYQKLNNTKENYLHHVTNKLLNDNQVVVMENLNVSGMLQNHKLARSIQELSLHRFKSMLEYKALWYGRVVIQIDQFYPSSKLCHVCNHKNDSLSLSDRTWTCNNCGAEHNRDHNASINILREGERLFNNKIGCRTSESTLIETSPVGGSLK